MKYFLPFCFLLAFGAFAQDEPISDMYWNNYSYYNPAMSGVRYQHEANVSHRRQFRDVITPSWFVNYGTNLKGKHGLGVNYVNEKTGFLRVNRVKLNYNYQFKLNEKSKLAIGAALSYRRVDMHYNWNWYCCDWYYYGPLNIFQADVGVAYYSEKITAGLALTQIPVYQSPNYVPHIMGNFRYEGDVFSLSSFILETRIQTDFARYRQDFNVGYKIKDFMEVGIGYRTANTGLINLSGIIKKNFRVGYSYALPFSALNSLSYGNHEITLGLRLPN